jgi:hypothetical protein
MEEEKSFNISRKILGLEFFDKPFNSNEHIYEIKNCSLNLDECKKYLSFSEQQIKNAIEMNILISLQFGNEHYFCIRSVLKIKNSKSIKEKILSQDNLNEAYIAKYLNLSPRNIKRLISEGYLNYISNENKYIKREEVDQVKSQLEEIQNFWKAKNKINRQLGAKKASKIRQEINKKSNFRELFLKSIESYPYKESKLLQIAFNLIALSYYIDRKSKRNIIDSSLIELFNKSIEHLLLKYKNSKFMRIYFLKSDKTFIKYCNNCKEKILKSPFYSNQVCNSCEIDYDFKSLVLISISILEYSFNLYVGYKKIKPLLESNNIQIALLSPCSKIEDQAFISSLTVSDDDINSFKIFQVTEFLEQFLKLKEPDFLT